MHSWQQMKSSQHTAIIKIQEWSSISFTTQLKTIPEEGSQCQLQISSDHPRLLQLQWLPSVMDNPSPEHTFQLQADGMPGPWQLGCLLSLRRQNYGSPTSCISLQTQMQIQPVQAYWSVWHRGAWRLKKTSTKSCPVELKKITVHHSPWRIPIVTHYAIWKTSMVGPNTHCSSILLTFFHQRSKNLVWLKSKSFRHLNSWYWLLPCLWMTGLLLDKRNILEACS